MLTISTTYANLLGKAALSMPYLEAKQLGEFEGLVAFPDNKFSNLYRKCKARSRLGILTINKEISRGPYEHLVAGFQSGIAQAWRCLYGMALLDEKWAQIGNGHLRQLPKDSGCFWA